MGNESILNDSISEDMKNIKSSEIQEFASKKTQHFVCILPAYQPKDYWESVDNGFNQAATDFAHYNITIEKKYFDQYDVQSFLQISEQIIDEKPDAVIIAPIFKEETLSLLKKLDNKNIPYSFIDSFLPETNPISYYGQNSFQSGYIASKLLINDVPEDAQIMIIRTKRKGTEAIQTISRYDGFMQYIKDNKLTGYVEYIDVEFIENDEDYNFKLLEQIFATYHNIKAAITFNSKVNRLAMHLASFNRKNIRIIGYDLLDLNVRYLKRGVIYCLIAQRPERQAYYSVRDMCRKIILKRTPNQTNYMPIDILFKENIEDYKNFYNI
ncbi:MAG: substrate-binding domain-containing protein [Paludibacteraceae bacterium]|nr:substrate-binding domain-containing protein [Paludibacteraceae bacterium]